MPEFLLLLFAAAVGFVAAGLVACLAAGASFALVGPYIVARGAIRARSVDKRPLGWLMAGLALAAGWSTCSGIVVLDLALSLGHGL